MKITCQWIKNERAQHKRGMGAPQILERDQAQCYAAFLLSREGIEADWKAIEVLFNPVRINGRNVRRAWQYRFQGKVYDFPHRDHMPAQPVEHTDLPLAA